MNATSTQIDLNIDNFNFDTKEMDMLHRQFSGERTNFIRAIDELLRCWGMSSAANPNLNFSYTLKASTHQAQTTERLQGFLANHVRLGFEQLTDDHEIGDAAVEVALFDPKDLIKLYDTAFRNVKAKGDLGVLASFFSLREVFARISPCATYVKAYDNTIITVFKDGEQGHLIAVTAEDFGHITLDAQAINDASLDATLDAASLPIRQ